MTEHTQDLIDCLRHDVDKWFFNTSADVSHDDLSEHDRLNTLGIEAQKAITYLYTN